MGETLVAPVAMEQGLLSSCLSRNADYEAYTGSMHVDESADAGSYIVSMIGSSTVQDLQGDIMLLSALDDMTKIPDNLTCFMNHAYEVPCDIYGGLYGRPWIKSSSGIADFHLKVETEASNPKAMQTYGMVSRGKRRLGCSIGCQVVDYEYDQDTDALIIKSVVVLEYSIVSIPANQRCWVEIATKSLFERSLLDGRGDDALKLAPAVKGMYSRSYDTILKHIESPGLKRDLEHVTPRGTIPHRIMTSFSSGETGFALADRTGITKSLTRDEVSLLLSRRTSDPIIKSIADTENSGALIRQDLAEKDDAMGAMPNASDVAITKEGSHVACKGTHEHSHKAFDSQGDDAQHEHSHSHDSDSNHDHAHAEKSAEPELTKEEEPAEIVTKEEDHQTVPLDVQEDVIDPAQVGLLSAYNTIGKQLGLEPATLHKDMSSAYDMQGLISCISEADRNIDLAMGLLTIPDIDAPSPYPVAYSFDVTLMKTFGDFLQKEGREISASNVELVKAMHDHAKATHDLCASMSPESCKCAGMSSTTVDAARQDAEFQMGNVNASFVPLTDAMQALAKALESMNVSTLQTDVHTAQKALETMQQQIVIKRGEVQTLNSNVMALANMPLGRPTHLNRNIAGEATFAEMKAASGHTLSLQESFALTTVKFVGGSQYRCWPSGVAAGVRPALTPDQKSLMHPENILAYQDGKEAYIPMIDDPAI